MREPLFADEPTRPAEPPTPGCNVCGHRTRYIPCAAPPLAADAVECCPTPTVISPWAEAQRFHPIKGRWFKSSPRNQDDEGLADARAASPFRLPRLHPGITITPS